MEEHNGRHGTIIDTPDLPDQSAHLKYDLVLGVLSSEANAPLRDAVRAAYRSLLARASPRASPPAHRVLVRFVLDATHLANARGNRSGPQRRSILIF